MSRATETPAGVIRAAWCGHAAHRGTRGPTPRLCLRCRRAAELAGRLRQATKIATDLGLDELALDLHRTAELYDPRRA